MPIAFKRRHLDDIALTSSPRYFVSEKTDGERYMLAVCMDKFGRHHCVFLSRGDGITAYTTVGLQQIGALLAPGTVLDGELVEERDEFGTIRGQCVALGIHPLGAVCVASPLLPCGAQTSALIPHCAFSDCAAKVLCRL